MLLSDFDFELPKELIAAYPSEERTSCRMLGVDGTDGHLEDRHFYDLPDYLRAGDVLVLNDTKVMRARLYGKKETGGAVEILVERLSGPDRALCHVRASKSPKAGSSLVLDGGGSLQVLERQGELFLLATTDGSDFYPLMESQGHIPLPPYIDRPDEPADAERYQTVYARDLGAVAAPTAGLHFDEAMLARLKAQGVEIQYVTLHVGAGTFEPVRTQDVTLHHMHQERMVLRKQCAQAVAKARAAGRRVVAVGTTAVRCLESAAQHAQQEGLGPIAPYAGETGIFIYPGYRYLAVDALITNFHLPQSTLIMLVAAFCGYERTMRAYAHAVDAGYHFFSYGDCMFLTKNPQASADLPPSARTDTNTGAVAHEL